MAKRKIEKCENYEFLPMEIQEKQDLILTEKNVLASLCMFHLKYSDFVRDNNGWFYTAISELSIESGVDDRTVCRTILKLRLKGFVATKRGTNHRCTWYKLSPKIVGLLPEIDDDEEVNVTLDRIECVENANVTLEKNRLDESSKDESRAIAKKAIEPAKDAAFVAASLKEKTEEQLEEEFKSHRERIFKELDERCEGKDYNTVRTVTNEALNSISNLFLEPYYERLRKVITFKADRLKQQTAFS